MQNFTTLLQQGNQWLFLPSAIILGLLHGLEPGHSKTMMMAFIIAIKGTIRQALILGLAATVSHTFVVWVMAVLGLSMGQQWQGERIEVYFQMLASCLVIGIALWMIYQVWQEKNSNREVCHHHEHAHVDKHKDEHNHLHDELGHGSTITLQLDGMQDHHSQQHALEIQKRFKRTKITNWQIFLFGITGGLIPCPAAIAILLICLQVKQFALGATIVLGFSVGLAMTLVTVGVISAVGVKYTSKKWGGLSFFSTYARYVSCILILLIGLYMASNALRLF